jgi:hypothetical protein
MKKDNQLNQENKKEKNNEKT